MSDSVKKYHENLEQKEMFPETQKKAEKIFVRLGFADKVISFAEAMDPDNEICSCDSFVVAYEDENGKECNSDGTYLDAPDPRQFDMFK